MPRRRYSMFTTERMASCKLVFLALLLTVVSLTLAKDVDRVEVSVCGKCETELCPKVENCLGGIKKDKCRCCDVCALKSGEICDHPKAPNVHVVDLFCGDNLECRLRDDLEEGSKPQALCFCKYDSVVCGSDGKTYENVCELSETAIVSTKDIRVQNMGACKSKPVIVTGPTNVRNVTGSHIFMLCEAKGFPIPTIEWTWSNKNKERLYLPSDDMHISVNSRGGPDRFEITGWLQIMDLQNIHQGDYACLAQNELGISTSKARINVDQKQPEL